MRSPSDGRSKSRFAVLAGIACALFVSTAAWSASAGPVVITKVATDAGLVSAGRVFGAGAGQLNGQVVIYGGQDGPGDSLADTWVNDPTGGWSARCGTTVAGATDPCGPGPREGHGMAAATSGTVLFGGFATGLGESPQGDTWIWNGSSWTQSCDATTCGPSARGLMAMAGNGATAVMFGGLGVSGLLDDAWVWNGASWTQTCGLPLVVSCGPSARAGASLAWDGHQFVLFGGTPALDGSTPPFDDTWVFDGTTFTQVCGTTAADPCGPPGRALAGFAFLNDPSPAAQGALLAEGGDLFNQTQSTLYRDAWLWSGNTWSEVTAPWTGTPITFPNSGAPAPGTDPLLGVLGARAGDCQVLYLAANVVSSNPVTLNSQTFLAGRDRANTGVPSGCATPPAPPPVPAPPAEAPVSIAPRFTG